MFSYRTILRRAWQFTRRSPSLWFFGLFAALLGNGGEYEIISRVFFPAGRPTFFFRLDSWSDFVWPFAWLSGLPVYFFQDPVAAFFIFFFSAVLLALLLFLVWAIIVSQGALVRAAALAFAGKTADFKVCLAAGQQQFRPVFFLNLLSRAASFFFLLFFLPAWFVTSTSAYLPALLYGLLALIALPAALAASFIGKYAIAYVVVKGENLISALKKGFRLFQENWLLSMEVALLLFLVNCAIGLLLIFLLMIIALPAYFFIVISQSIWFMVLILILFLALIASAGAVIAVFQTAAWTMLFAEISGRGGLSKIIRIFKRA